MIANEEARAVETVVDKHADVPAASPAASMSAANEPSITIAPVIVASGTEPKVEPRRTAEVIVVTSGKGGVGKTTTSASLACGLARAGKRVAVIDFDVGLRNLDLIMGCERRVVYDFVNVIHNECNLKQALIKDKRFENLYVLAASQTRDKDALTKEGVQKVLDGLAEDGFEYIVCDSPAGIEKGAFLAMYFADQAVVVVNPEVSSVRDSDRILGLLASKTRRAEKGERVREHLLLTRYSPKRVESGDMLSIKDVQEILGLDVVGVIPEAAEVLQSSNSGEPVILDANSQAGQAYEDAVARLLGEKRPLRFVAVEKKGFFSKIFGG
jgi:septum site-determining protein MinD